MTKLILILTAFIVILMASVPYVDYNIEICIIPLKDIVLQQAQIFVGNIRHVFIRGNDGTGFSGLIFEPQWPWGFLGGKARIGRQNYQDATCKTILSTTNKEKYEHEWDKFVKGYEEYAQSKRYSIGSMNCQHVTKAILENLGYKIPKTIEKELDF